MLAAVEFVTYHTNEAKAHDDETNQRNSVSFLYTIRLKDHTQHVMTSRNNRRSENIIDTCQWQLGRDTTIRIQQI
jgi:hypothetical protein